MSASLVGSEMCIRDRLWMRASDILALLLQVRRRRGQAPGLLGDSVLRASCSGWWSAFHKPQQQPRPAW
eukprot:8079757-Alexandrium_andersonii.AAC.1